MVKHFFRGFTLIELLVVMAIVGTLLTIAFPKYFKSIDRSKEAVLRQDLNIMRDALDKFNADTGNFPSALEELVTKGYLRAIPIDPMTESATTWIIIPSAENEQLGVFNVKSGSKGLSPDGSAYSTW